MKTSLVEQPLAAETINPCVIDKNYLLWYIENLVSSGPE
jgi:hypothetical protein